MNDFITERHLENSAKVMLATGLIVAYGYGMEAFMNWYGGNPYETFLLLEPAARALRLLVLLAADLQYLLPQVLWIHEVPHSTVLAVYGFTRCAGRHVAGAVHHRGRQFDTATT